MTFPVAHARHGTGPENFGGCKRRGLRWLGQNETMEISFVPQMEDKDAFSKTVSGWKHSRRSDAYFMWLWV